jgi:hypothetical protein
MSKALEELREALYGSGLVQPVDAKGRGGSVSVLCRQLPGQEAPWIAVVDRLLAVAEEKGIDLHVCRRYVRRQGSMVFGWFLGVEAKNAASLVEEIGTLLDVLKEAKPELDSVQAPQARQATPQPRYDTDERAYRRLVAQKRVKTLTTASPRAPERLGPDPVAPPTAKGPALKVVARGVDDKGRPTDVVEMPLPHTYREQNVPKELKGGPLKFEKGAIATPGGGT